MQHGLASFVSYLRVSTKHQGADGYGIDAQHHSVQHFLSSRDGRLIDEFTEVESGRSKDRPELAKAIALCRQRKAVLVIGRLDRLARNAAFLLNLRDSGITFVACDM